MFYKGSSRNVLFVEKKVYTCGDTVLSTDDTWYGMSAVSTYTYKYIFTFKKYWMKNEKHFIKTNTFFLYFSSISITCFIFYNKLTFLHVRFLKFSSEFIVFTSSIVKLRFIYFIKLGFYHW